MLSDALQLSQYRSAVAVNPLASRRGLQPAPRAPAIAPAFAAPGGGGAVSNPLAGHAGRLVRAGYGAGAGAGASATSRAAAAAVLSRSAAALAAGERAAVNPLAPRRRGGEEGA